MTLRDLRKQNKMTARQVADKLDLTENAIYNYESGIRKLDFEVACKIAKVYDISLEELAEIYIGSNSK